jgi:uncharacterized protein YggE
MSTKRIFVTVTAVAMIVIAIALPAHAQKTPQPGTHITVSKSGGGMN